MAEPEVERVRNLQSQGVARVVDDDGAVALECELCVAVEPGAGRCRVPKLALVGDGCKLVEREQRCGQGLARRRAVEHEPSNTETMGCDGPRVARQRGGEPLVAIAARVVQALER